MCLTRLKEEFYIGSDSLIVYAAKKKKGIANILQNTIIHHSILVSKEHKAKAYTEFGVKRFHQLLPISLGHLISMHFSYHHQMPSQSFRREIACKSLDREREKERGPQTCGINAHAHTQTQKETIEEIIYEYNSNWLSNIHYFFIST